MSYILLWIEVWIASLLWMAMWTTCFARWRFKWLGSLATAAVMLVPALATALFAFWAGDLKFVARLTDNWFVYAISLFLAVLVGCETIVILARRSADRWRAGPLALAWLAAVAVVGMTFWNIDLAIVAKANLLALEAQTRCIAEMPAIVSDAENAAPFYELAFARLNDDPPSDVRSWPTGPNRTFDAAEPAVKTYLEREDRTIALLRRAAAMPSLRFEKDWDSFDMSRILPELNQERLAANILCLHASYELANGQVASAMVDVAAVKRMSRQFGQRPLLVSGLVGMGIDALGVVMLQRALPSVTQASELAGINYDDTASLRIMLRRTFQSEECYGLASFRSMSAMPMTPGFAAPHQALMGAVMPPPLRDFLLPGELDSYLDLMDRLQDAVLEPFYQAKSAVMEIGDTASPTYRRGIFTPILAPSFRRAIVTTARAEAGDACAQVALAMTHYRLDHGAMPSKLDDLVPAYLDSIPLDPFDGKPLRLAIKKDAWIIYSVGEDGVDDGGVEMNSHGKGDVIFTLKPASHR